MKKKYKIWIYLLTLIIFGLILKYCCMVCKEEGTGTSNINVYDTVTVSGNSVPIDTTATVYKFSSGVELIVPPGAVKENVTVSFGLLDSISASQTIPLDVFAGKVYCAGLTFGQPGTKFLKPITIRVPAPNYEYNDVPSVYLYNSVSNSWSQFTDSLVCSEKEHFIEFSTDRPLSARIELIKDVLGLGKSETKSTEGEMKDIDCHLLLVKVVTQDYDYIGQLASGACQSGNQKVNVEFTACKGKPVETAEIQEIGKACQPVAKCIPSKPCLNKNESATLNFEVTIGGIALAGQQIYITLPAGLTSTMDPLFGTNKDGKAAFTVTCNSDSFISGTIKYSVHYNYYLESVNASAGGVTETTNRYQKNQEITYPQTISSCSAPTSISLTQPTYWYFDVGDTYQIVANCSPAGCGILEYSVVDGYPTAAGAGIVSIDANGLVTFNNPGVVFIVARGSGLVSEPIALSASYQGSMVLYKYIDENTQDVRCCCEQDKDPITGQYTNCWIMTYNGNLHFKFWLNIDKNKSSFGTLDKGCEDVTYTITPSSKCKSETQYYYLSSFGDIYDSSFTNEIISGNVFNFTIGFNWWQYAGGVCEQPNGVTPLNNTIILFGSLTGPGVITITGINYSPEDQCLGRVNLNSPIILH